VASSRFLAARELPAAEIAARIRRDPTINDEVRTRALFLLGQGTAPWGGHRPPGSTVSLGEQPWA
jgi:hypothetical protein